MVRFDLPWDLVDEILSRVPATSLQRLQYTCKRWNALFKDPEFITKQLDKAVKQNLVLMWSNFRVYSLRINFNEIQNDNIAFDPSIEFTAQHSQQVEISQLFHCNGLLLCSTKEANKTKLVVVNPCTGQTRWIEPRSDYKKHDIYALGYENNNKKSYDSYKILRISYGGKLLKIFELKSNSWRVLPQVPPNMDLDLRIYGQGESLKGNTYWFCFFYFNIVSFDFTTEKFRRVPLPFPYANEGFYTFALSVVREEQLLVLRSRFYMGKIEIWVGNKIDTETMLTWSKSFTFDFVSLRDLPFIRILSFFFEEDKKVIVVGCGTGRSRSEENYKNMIYIVGKHGSKKLDYETDQSNCRPFFLSYVPSLVTLYPPM